MSGKIEKTWGTIFGQTAVRRKESADKDGSSNEQNPGREKKERPADPETPKSADRQSVEKAMTDLRSENHFTETGMRVEVINSKDGLRIRLAHANGSTVKVMTAEEFMKLRESSDGEQAARGKILDQKY